MFEHERRALSDQNFLKNKTYALFKEKKQVDKIQIY